MISLTKTVSPPKDIALAFNLAFKDLLGGGTSIEIVEVVGGSTYRLS